MLGRAFATDNDQNDYFNNQKDRFGFGRPESRAISVDGRSSWYEHGSMIPTPAQFRAARALLNWSAQDLASRADVARMTIARLEDERDEKNETVSVGIAKKAAAVLEAAGIVFVWPDFNAGEGVRRATPGPRYNYPEP